MPSSCEAWHCFGGLTPRAIRSQEELRWIAAIDARWALLTDLQRIQVQEYAAQWGPNSCPFVPREGTEDFLKAKTWRHIRGVPRCESCWASNAPLPAVQDVPLGLEPREVMPCGCEWEVAMVELWAVGHRLWCHRQADGRIRMMDVRGRTLLRDTLSFLWGGVSAAKLFNWRGQRPALRNLSNDEADALVFRDWPEES